MAPCSRGPFKDFVLFIYLVKRPTDNQNIWRSIIVLVTGLPWSVSSPFEWFVFVPEFLARLVQLYVPWACLLLILVLFILGALRVFVRRWWRRWLFMLHWTEKFQKHASEDSVKNYYPKYTLFRNTELLNRLCLYKSCTSFTSVGKSLSDSTSDTLECPETSSLSSVFILSRSPETQRNTSSAKCLHGYNRLLGLIFTEDLLRSADFSAVLCCSWLSYILSNFTSMQPLGGPTDSLSSSDFTGLLLPGRLKSLHTQI